MIRENLCCNGSKWPNTETEIYSLTEQHNRHPKYATCWNTWKEVLVQKVDRQQVCEHTATQTDERRKSKIMTQKWGIHTWTISIQKREKVIYALRVSAHSGPGRPSEFAGRPSVCVWAASCRQSLPPNGHCSLQAACKPPPPAGKAAPLTPYLQHSKQTESRAQCLKITGLNGSTGGQSVIHQCRYNVNNYDTIAGKSNIVS